MSISEMKTHPDIPPCQAIAYGWIFVEVYSLESYCLWIAFVDSIASILFPVVFSWAARCSVRRHIQNMKIDFFPVRMLSVARTLVCYIIASAPIHLSLNQATNQLQSRKKLHMFACWQITRSRNKDLLRLLQIRDSTKEIFAKLPHKKEFWLAFRIRWSLALLPPLMLFLLLNA